MNPIVLGGVLKNFYPNFSIAKFEDRLKIQKIFYLMKSKGIGFGYNFGLYLYGPYSKELCRDAYQMNDLADFEKISTLVPGEEIPQKKFIEFREKIKDKKDNPKWLEIVASLIFIKRNGLAEDEEGAINIILSKRENIDITEKEIRKVINEIKGGYFEWN